ncbi:hypothetical protein [Streptomyces goshikiensis]|nr:hypothetical protein OG224_00125 [Streptomyces goshikiensis]WSS02975.1 hypothetical protein OG224_35690 [Streptomyces goshikiensis]WSS03927.1 hypothetical protein OG224_38535 [Streptomyces goshikiensis]
MGNRRGQPADSPDRSLDQRAHTAPQITTTGMILRTALHHTINSRPKDR